jgi:ERCC4-type nuclease
MKIIVDERERTVLDHLRQLPHADAIVIESQVLPLGDFLVCQDDDTPVLLYERKSFADLLSSIKDGRYEEQSYRLLNDDRFPVKRDIVYVLEGAYSQLVRKEDKTMILSSLTSLMYFKGFSVLRTSSAQDTAETLLAMTDKLRRDFDRGKQRALGDCAPSAYSGVVKKVKKDNITAENIGEIMLCQVPGISSTTARAIMEHVSHNMGTLIETLEERPEEIAALKIGEKQRKISKKHVDVLKTYLCKKKDHS